MVAGGAAGHSPGPSDRPTSVHRMTFPLALYSEPWNIFTLVMDSMDLPSIGLTTLQKGGRRVSSDSAHDLSWTEPSAEENGLGIRGQFLEEVTCTQCRCRKDLPEGFQQSFAAELRSCKVLTE